MQRIALLSLGYGVGFGSLEVAIPAFAESHGGRSLGAIGLACWSSGSLVGGLLAAGTGVDPRKRLRRSPRFLCLLVLPLLAWSLPSLAVVMFLVGLPIAPSFALTYGMVQGRRSPAARPRCSGG